MPNHVVEIDAEISQLKRLLENTAEQYQYNFNHPKVISLSQRLDGLILEFMKNQGHKS